MTMYEDASYEEVCLRATRQRNRRVHQPGYFPSKQVTYASKQQQQTTRRTRRGGRGRARRQGLFPLQPTQVNVALDATPFAYSPTPSSGGHLVFLRDVENECPVALLPSGQLVEVLPTAHNLAGATIYAPRSTYDDCSADEEDEDDDDDRENNPENNAAGSPSSVFGQRALEEAVAACLEAKEQAPPHQDDDACSIAYSVSTTTSEDESEPSSAEDDHEENSDDDDDQVSLPSDHLFDFLEDDEPDQQQQENNFV